ncbi:MAG: N-6 DNA Methylase family [Parcubacteria group bacterium GW2011_GWC2_39_14]|nr:MAG: N-6 DNA Methylase family [Parcubacteria group bacterium GW2011_GWC2_39_14]KKR54743.1 MAG: N-6 DNA Methylase family [Parcubacteria group bacterium GW2011_GWA2_40_23]
MNERKTEIITRDHFSKFLDTVYIEEQRSDNPKIDKLLKSASKKGGGKGYPEFIISYKTNPDLLIVIECKADVIKHESKDRDKYADFSVDGALLYASYLSKGFDVLAVAVSGETKQALKVSHFLHLKDEKKATQIFGDKFLSVDDYLNGYLKSPEKFRQDYNSLLDFTKQLNEKLHTYKILESQRSLLISSILIALENTAFKRSYASHKKAENLAVSLIQTVSDELESANITGEKLENLNTQFSFIKTDTSLSKKENVLKEIIDEIDENINAFIKTHRYFDVLGQLYIEFLRYANSDKGLGIVLTPPHITELFADLAQVNKNSIAYDNCTGTGGFLISAMKKMIADAKGDETKIKEIKSKQLIGTEYQSHIFALAVSNMYIHQDGKTNIINGSCFDEEVIEEVKTKKPTVGFLNPPYKDKKGDTEELKFVLNNLECLVDGGICVAIIPLSSVIAKNGIKLQLKEQLLQNHTLEAILSMPEDLFHNSKVSPVSVVVVFTAHKPHPAGKKTWLGYFRNDNFVKTKDKGRIDLLGTWEETKKEWLTLYFNRETKKDISLTRELKPQDEWCIEAYLTYDYNEITAYKLKDKIQKYLAFRLLHDLLDFKIDKPNKLKYVNKLIPLHEIFDVTNGLASSNVEVLESPENPTDIRYIRPSQTYEGSIAGYVDKTFIDDKYIYPDNTLYVSTDGQGSHTYSYVSSFEFIPNSNISVLMPKRKMSVQEKIYYALCVSSNRYKFSYGRKPKGDRLKDILLPLYPPEYVYGDIFNEIFDNWKKIVK